MYIWATSLLKNFETGLVRLQNTCENHLSVLIGKNMPAFSAIFFVKGSSQHKVGGEWFEIKLGKISRMLVKYEVLPITNVIFVC